MKDKLSFFSCSLYFLTTILLLIGWVILYSAAKGNADEWANKQLYSGIFFIFCSIAIALVPTGRILQISYPFFFFCIILLIASEVTGHSAMGAQRWLKLGAITIQPSELTKIGVVLAIARYFSQKSYEEIGKIKNLVAPLAMLCLPVIIILRQPNLGTSALIVLIAGAMFFAAGVRIWKFIVVISTALLSMPLIWNFMHDYQKKRVMTFLDPEADILGAGYNIMQSKIAIGSGGLYGKGFMHGTQVQLSFLPEKHTDFVFTILAEEFGFYGVVFVLLSYLLLIYMIYFISFRVKNSFGKILSIGVASMIFFHLFINVGMISGLLPVVGTPLPLLSYGRSNLITTILGIGLVLNAEIYRDKSQAKLLK